MVFWRGGDFVRMRCLGEIVAVIVFATVVKSVVMWCGVWCCCAVTWLGAAWGGVVALWYGGDEGGVVLESWRRVLCSWCADASRPSPVPLTVCFLGDEDARRGLIPPLPPASVPTLAPLKLLLSCRLGLRFVVMEKEVKLSLALPTTHCSPSPDELSVPTNNFPRSPSSCWLFIPNIPPSPNPRPTPRNTSARNDTRVHRFHNLCHKVLAFFPKCYVLTGNTPATFVDLVVFHTTPNGS